MAFETIVTDLSSRGVASITLNRPDRGNALSSKMIDEIANPRPLLVGETFAGKVVKIAGVEYKVVGVNPRSYRKPVKLERVRDGRGFKCSGAFLPKAAA